VRRLNEAAESGPGDPIVAGALLRDLDAHHLDGRDRAQAVLALEVALHLGRAFGQRAEQRRAMRDRLVAGDLALAGQPLHGTHTEVHASPSRVVLSRARSSSMRAASPATSKRSTSSRAARNAARLARTASLLAIRMSRHIGGSAAAMRVVSRKPRAAKASAPGSNRATASTRAHAATCGKWLIAATVRSCVSGSSALTRAPRASHNAVTPLMARRS